MTLPKNGIYCIRTNIGGYNINFGDLLKIWIWQDINLVKSFKSDKGLDRYAIEKILGRFKLGDCMKCRQFAKFCSSPIFVLIR